MTAADRARGLVDALSRRAFVDVVAGFDDTMRAAISVAGLEQIWDTTLTQVGPLAECTGTEAGQQGAHCIVEVNCRFANAMLVVRVVYDAEQRVAGLFFKPQAAPYTLPAYATPEAFREREVTVGTEPWELPGTLTWPSAGGPAAAVVLVHGSGPNDRDETVGARKPFADLARGLATRGIAVLRYDKRTRVHGARMAASRDLTVAQESIDDALAGAALLRGLPEIDARRVFVAGHSLGGELAPRIGERDAELAGLIVLAGSTRPIGAMMIEQLEYLYSLGGPRTAAQDDKLAEVRATWARVVEIQRGARYEPGEILLGAPPAYWLDLAGYDAPALAKTLSHPMFVVHGGRDYQVTSGDFARWHAALGGRPGATLKLYPALDHLLSAGEGKSTPADYQRAEHVHEEVVRDIAAWISGQPVTGRA